MVVVAFISEVLLSIAVTGNKQTTLSHAQNIISAAKKYEKERSGWLSKYKKR